MTDWQLTATTIFCDTTGKEVTIFVYKDGSVNCTCLTKTDIPPGECSLECPRLTGYRDKLFEEEKNASG